MTDDGELHGLEVLSPAECLRLLGRGRIGRVGFVSDDESPNRTPATVPYTAAFIERSPSRP